MQCWFSRGHRAAVSLADCVRALRARHPAIRAVPRQGRDGELIVGR